MNSLERLTIVGAWTIFKRPTSQWADSRFTWPFGRLVLSDDAIVLSVRGPLGKLFATASRLGRVAIPVVIPIKTIRQIEVRDVRGWLAFRLIKIHCQDPNVDGVELGGRSGLIFGTCRIRRSERPLEPTSPDSRLFSSF